MTQKVLMDLIPRIVSYPSDSAIQRAHQLHCDIFHCWGVFAILSLLFICKGNFHTAVYFSYALNFMNTLHFQRLFVYICRLTCN